MILSMKHVLIGVISIIVLLIFLSLFTGIGIKSFFGSNDPPDILRDQIRKLTEENEELKSINDKYILENTNLKIEIRGLVVSQQGGMAAEEKRT